jgi:hypothetical protein
MKDSEPKIHFEVDPRSIKTIDLTSFFKDNAMSTREQIVFARDFWYPRHQQKVLSLSNEEIVAEYDNPYLAKLFILLNARQTQLRQKYN